MSKRVKCILTLIRDGAHAECGVFILGNSLFIETKYLNIYIYIYSNQGKIQKFYSEKQLVPETLYHICIVVEIDELTDVTLYINGNQDAESSLPGYDPLTDSDLILGLYRMHPSFTGQITEFLIFFEAISPKEIKDIYIKGKSELRKTGELTTSREIFESAQNTENRGNYARTSNCPEGVVQTLALTTEADEEEFLRIRTLSSGGELDTFDRLTDLFEKEPRLEGVCRDVALNYVWLFNTLTALCNGGIPDKYTTIEIGRFVPVLKAIGISITTQEAYHIAKLLHADLEEPNRLSIFIYDFMTPLRSRFAPPTLNPPTPRKTQNLIMVEGEADNGDPVPIQGIIYYIYTIYIYRGRRGRTTKITSILVIWNI